MSKLQDKNDDLGPRGGEGIASSNNQDQEAKESEIERGAVAQGFSKDFDLRLMKEMYPRNVLLRMENKQIKYLCKLCFVDVYPGHIALH
jgi:hypothetical protein